MRSEDLVINFKVALRRLVEAAEHANAKQVCRDNCLFCFEEDGHEEDCPLIEAEQVLKLTDRNEDDGDTRGLVWADHPDA